MQEYAVAFLKPVKKTEAWDYDRGKSLLSPLRLQILLCEATLHGLQSVPNVFSKTNHA